MRVLEITQGLPERLRRRGIIPGEPLAKAVGQAIRRLADIELPAEGDLAVSLPPIGLTAWLHPVPNSGWSILYTFTDHKVVVRNVRNTG